ncbi:uncharacterized protein LOC5513583 [Nematostella vectensis]|uniref:uncharacterized protein LOC5513583 n=1 Tax=Nematostella vectensis TaxID=45351 RepID=UPI002076FD1B|nr:uncharacterized protein LOC5513583 [Nematostella vectensis]
MAAGTHYKLPGFVAFWLSLSTVIVVIDGLVVILRPRTLPGGDLNYLVKPYNLYFPVDKRYADMEDTFGVGQSWMNLVEAFLNIIALSLHLRSSTFSAIMALIVCTMTWAKTILYFLVSTELCGGAHYIAHNPWKDLILFYYLPNGIWIVVPLICMLILAQEINAVMCVYYQANGKKKI